MIGSLWRNSHFILASVSALFLILASVTGVILSLEPISKASQPFLVTSPNSIRLSETITALKKNYTDVLKIEITAEDFVKASVISKKGNNEIIYINPRTGKKIGNVLPQSTFFSFITNLHRSLFLKSLGRLFVGIISLLLCLISITGLFLMAQRQGGFKKVFKKVKETNFAQRYHVIFTRWFFIPIIIIASTGVYLSLEKFSILKTTPISHTFNKKYLKKGRDLFNIKTFNDLSLNEVRSLAFPFSKDSEDYFQLALNDREILINQYNGEVVSEVLYPFSKIASQWNMTLHTGRGNVLWSVILLLSSISILFFIFSGFTMSLNQRKRIKKAKMLFNKDEAEYIILVGSETGKTFSLARIFFRALIKEGKKAHLASLNDYNSYENVNHMIVFTSTYGDGDAPSNAVKFEKLFKKIQVKNKIRFSVVGFGSLEYPHFCYFAIKIDALLHSHHNFIPLNEVSKIDDQSESSFLNWIKNWNKNTRMNLNIKLNHKNNNPTLKYEFEVIKRTILNSDNTSILRLKSKKKITFQSGDLFNIKPPLNSNLRKYSIAKIEGDIILSVKWHPKGICSTYLCTLKEGDIISASIEKNEKFYFPKEASSVWLIANGTGIAPFLGMIIKNAKTNIQLIWGGRTKDSFQCYKEVLEDYSMRSKKNKIIQNQMNTFQFALSQSNEKEHVQDLILKNQTRVIKALEEGEVFMICGSIKMQNSVLNTLNEISKTNLERPLSYYQNNGQILMDCY